MAATSSQTAEAVRTQMKEGETYFRVNFKIDRPDLDNTSPQYINSLIKQAHQATETDYFDHMINVVCGQSVKTMTAAA